MSEADKTPSWETFEHAADMGVRGLGPTAESAFEMAALALTATVTDIHSVRPDIPVEIECEAPDRELLFVEWLNQLIYEMDTRKMLFGRYEVRLEGERRLKGTAFGEPVDVAKHQPAVYVKGATLTALSVRQEDGGWIAQCIIDV